MTAKIKALLATGRISNLPTVWCNCIVPVAILLNHSPNFLAWTKYISSEHPGSMLEYPVIIALYLVISSSLIYVGGCFLGDAVDEKYDQAHKPYRPIPANILNKKTVYLSAWFMLVLGGLTALIPSSSFSLADIEIETLTKSSILSTGFIITPIGLLLAVISYSYLHKKHPIFGLPLIGLCRFMLIIFAAGMTAQITPLLIARESIVVPTPFFTPSIIIYASVVCLYTIGFASVARTEASDSPITWRKLLRYTMLALPLTLLFTNQRFQIETITALLIYALWLTYAFTFLDRDKGNYVSKCLAGFCLLDACFVAQFGWIWLIVCLILFLLALALQKIAPAT